MTKPTKAQLRKAKAHSLRVYRLALKAAERGKWDRADDLAGCESSFCDVQNDFCHGCPVGHICQKRMPRENAWRVCHDYRTPANGLRHFRKTIEQLEALEF